MKRWIPVVLVLLFCRCTNHHRPVDIAATDRTVHRVDTFGLVDLRIDPFRQQNIRLNTLEVQPDQHHLGITALVPVIEDLPAVSRWVDSLVKDKVKGFKESVQDERVETDTILKMKTGWSMWISPLSFYRGDKMLSFSMESRHGYTGTPSWYEYHIINFDLEMKKRMRLEDYFILSTAADTAALANLVCRSVYCKEVRNAIQYLQNPGIYGVLKFAVDADFVYFFFDKGELFDGGHIGSVRKKFISDRLRPEYR